MMKGTVVTEKGKCNHRPVAQPLTLEDHKCNKRYRQYADPRDCFHTPSKISLRFADNISYWVINRYGYAKRVMAERIKAI